jgi:predicted GIY-YIG superfamily endonuclease
MKNAFLLQKWWCYLLKNSHQKHLLKTYNGSTNNIQRRLRQHNKELAGGAKYTSKYGESTWEYFFLMTGFPDNINCLQAEWRMKYPTNKKPRPKIFNSPQGRINGINQIIKLEKWTNNSTINNQDMKLQIYILKEYAHLLSNCPKRISINIVDNFSSYFLSTLDSSNEKGKKEKKEKKEEKENGEKNEIEKEKKEKQNVKSKTKEIVNMPVEKEFKKALKSSINVVENISCEKIRCHLQKLGRVLLSLFQVYRL